MTVQGSSDGQAFVRNAVTKITVFFVSKSQVVYKQIMKASRTK